MTCGNGIRALVCALALAAAMPARAQSGKTFKARLAPVPVDLAMQPHTTGSGSVTAVLSGRTLTISGTFEGLRGPATIAQLHKGPITGVRGPMIFDLIVTKATRGTISGTFDLTPIQASDLEKRRLYVQLHSERAPDGNLWGWLLAQENKR